MSKFEKLLVKFEARYKSLQQLSGFENKVRARQAKRAYLDLKKVIRVDSED
jgi:hypothetical protein